MKALTNRCDTDKERTQAWTRVLWPTVRIEPRLIEAVQVSDELFGRKPFIEKCLDHEVRRTKEVARKLVLSLLGRKGARVECVFMIGRQRNVESLALISYDRVGIPRVGIGTFEHSWNPELRSRQKRASRTERPGMDDIHARRQLTQVARDYRIVEIERASTEHSVRNSGASPGKSCSHAYGSGKYPDGPLP